MKPKTQTTPTKPKTLNQALQRMAELEEELQRLNAANRRLEALNQTGQLVSASLNVDQVFDIILAQIARAVPFDSATLMLVEQDKLRAVAARGFANQHLALNLYPASSRNSAWRVAQRKAPMVIPDVRVTTEWESRSGLGKIRAWMGIPLIVKEEVVGVLTLDSHRPGTYTPADAELVYNLGYQVAMAVENAFLFERLKTQRDQMSKLQELNRAIASILNLDTLLQAIMEKFSHMLGSQRSSLWLFDRAGSTAAVKAWYGIDVEDSEAPATTFIVAEYPIMQQMLTRSQPLIINPVDPPFNHSIWVGADKNLPLLLVPLCYKEKNIGFIVTDNTEAREAFLPDRLTLAMNAANQAALSIENARLYRDATQRLNDLAVLHDAGQSFISTLDLDEVLGIIMERTCAALMAEYGYVLLTNEAQTSVTFLATVGPHAQTLKGHTIPLIGTVMGTVVKQGKALLIGDTASLPQFFAEIDSHLHAVTRSLMVAPLKTRRGILGALIVTNKQEDKFTATNLNLLTSLSQLASGAIENARLFRQVQEYSRDLKEAVVARTVHLTAVNETSRAISGIVAMDELFDKVTRFISELFNQARVSVGLRTGNYLTFQTIYDGELEPGVVPPTYRLRIDKSHILGSVVLTGEADFIETISTAELYRLDHDNEAPTTALVVPLAIGGKTTGIIVVQSRFWLASQQQDMETLQSLASQVAVAMENARLLQKSREMATIQERTRLARDMHDGIAQNLAYLLLQVDRALDMAGTDTAKLESQLEKISGVITQNIEELRRHIFNLRPVGLEGRSIFKVIRQMAAEFADQFSIKTDCRIIGAEIDLPSDVEASLYRIFQEALSNIQRHARCRQVWITLKTGADKTVELTLEDDGAGFDPSKITSSPFQYHGLGLVSMQERIRNLGGTLEIESAPGHGTRIRICVPAL